MELINFERLKTSFFLILPIVLMFAVILEIYYTSEEAKLIWGIAIGMMEMFIIIIFAVVSEEDKS